VPRDVSSITAGMTTLEAGRLVFCVGALTPLVSGPEKRRCHDQT